MKMKSKRNYQLDNIRAIAILLVVFGHSIILYSSQWNLYSTNISVPFLDIVKKWINLIQMPAFFALSGFLFSMQYKKTTFLSLIKNKAKRLLVPYFVVSILYMIPIKMLVHYPAYTENSILEIILSDILLCRDNGHLWYLPCLFVCFIIGKVVLELSDKIKLSSTVKKGALICLFIAFSLLSGKIGGLSFLHGILLPRDIAKYFIWFYVGYCIESSSTIITICKNKKWYLLGLGVIMSVFSIIRSTKLDFLTSLLLLIALFVFIPETENKIGSYLSMNSFGVYLLHSPLIYITFTFLSESNPIIVVLLNFLIFGSVSLLIAEFIRKTPVAFLIGYKAKKQ